MRRTYADLHLCANLNESSQRTDLIEKASMLGYGLVSIQIGRAHV